MNNKGIFITFMVFLLITSILTLHNVAKLADSRQERKDIKGVAFNVVNNAFNNMYEEVVSMSKEGYARDVQQRPMPFEYDFNGNSLLLSQRIPAREPTLNAYVDALNIYSIFANSDEGKADLDISTSTIKDERWGGPGFPDLNYAILPQCLLLDVNKCCEDVNLFALRELQAGENGCIEGFDYRDFNIVDINIAINTSGCASGGISGNLAGTEEEFLPDSLLPYLWIRVNEVNPQCPGTGCVVTGNGEEIIRTHFDPTDYTLPSEIDSLIIQCDSANWVRVKVGKQDDDDLFPLVVYNWMPNQAIRADLNITFDQKVDLLYFTGFSISVEKKNFPIKRRT